jgi:hypothetical protein
MADQGPPKPTPIYVSYLTFTNLLDWLHDLGTLPSQFDRTFWGHKFSGSGGGQLMAGLRWLRLLNGDEPQPELEALAMADGDERQRLIKELLERAYGAEFVAGLPRHTPKLINEHLVSLGTSSATHDKARSFFVNAAKAVGLQMQPAVAKQARNRPTVTRKSGHKAKTETPAETVDHTPVEKPFSADVPGGLNPLILTLLRDLEREGPNWNLRARNRFRQMWDQTLDYAYPANDEEDEAEGQ